MYLITHWRLLVGALVLACLPLIYMKGRSDGRQLERLAVASAQSQANDNAREVERLRQRSVDAAMSASAAREASLRADADRARGALGGLRDATDVAERVAQESSAAAQQARSALGVVVNQCSARLQEVARDADLARSEAAELRQAWPK